MEDMCHVFISYVREDSEKVNIIKSFLEYYKIKVWIDRESLSGGERWKAAIRESIKRGSFFIACFSDNYINKDISYMNEELIIAIEELRLRPYNRKWFIPIRLSNCEIPARPIGAGETLQDIQRIDMFNNFFEGLSKLLSIVTPIMSPSTHAELSLNLLLKKHIEQKIQHFTNLKALRVKEIEDSWLGLLDDHLFNQISEAFCSTVDRMKISNCNETERMIESGDKGRVIIISVAPKLDQNKLLNSLQYSDVITGDRYSDFVIHEKRKNRGLQNWQYRDFVHIIYSIDNQDAVLELLYLLNMDSYIKLTSFILFKQKRGEQVMPTEQIYPMSLMSTYQISELVRIVMQEDVAAYKK